MGWGWVGVGAVMDLAVLDDFGAVFSGLECVLQSSRCAGKMRENAGRLPLLSSHPEYSLGVWVGGKITSPVSATVRASLVDAACRTVWLAHPPPPP